MQLLDAQKRPGNSRSLNRIILSVLFVVLFVLSTLFYLVWDHYRANDQHVTADFGGLEKPVFYQGKMLELSAIGEKEGLKLPFSAVKELLDPLILYESQSESVIITTKDKVVRLKTNLLTAMVNEKPFTIRFPVEKVGEILYVPMEPLRQYYTVIIRESAETGAIIIAKQDDAIQWGRVLANAKQSEPTVPMRTNATVKAPILSDVASGEKLMIWSEENGWYHVQLSNGHTGFMQKKNIALDHVEMVPAPKLQPPFVAWKPVGGKINLTWEQVQRKIPDTAAIGPMPGLNVVSPTWFHLADTEGNLKNHADPAYVKWAHDRNYQVWALFSNSFDPKLTSAALDTHDKRMKMINQLLSFAQMYQLQGFNIDFENVFLKDKDNVTQFVREMVPFMHEQGLVVSIDVTTKSNSETWSLFYDRRALAEVVDYMMVMTYDEHWAASPKAGSVASLPWVEQGILQIMKEDEVPASKLVLGIPYYTRIWTEQPKDGKLQVSSKAVFMDAVNKIIAEKNLTPVFSEETAQNYVEYKEGDKTMKIWIEDEVSIRARAELVKKYDLAGLASWRRGYEKPEVWTIIKETLEKRP